MHADVLRAINVQINSEFSAWYQYLAMAAFCEREMFTGAAKWLKAQSAEEYQHGMKLFDFVHARNGVVELIRIEQPTREFESFGEVFEVALKQEESVTAQINALYELCFKSKAFAEMTELQWFLTEQVEEEKTSRELVAKFRLVGDDPGSLLDLDRELGYARHTVAPTAARRRASIAGVRAATTRGGHRARVARPGSHKDSGRSRRHAGRRRGTRSQACDGTLAARRNPRRHPRRPRRRLSADAESVGTTTTR